MDWDLQYGELSNDKEFVSTCEELKANLQEVQGVLDQLLPLKAQYEQLPLAAQIELDLFLAYTLTALHWVHLRLRGVDPTRTAVRGELQRIQAAMLKWQEVQERDKRPTVDVEAAKRFVRSGLYDPYKGTAKPQNKKIKFDENAQ